MEWTEATTVDNSVVVTLTFVEPPPNGKFSGFTPTEVLFHSVVAEASSLVVALLFFFTL